MGWASLIAAMTGGHDDAPSLPPSPTAPKVLAAERKRAKRAAKRLGRRRQTCTIWMTLGEIREIVDRYSNRTPEPECLSP